MAQRVKNIIVGIDVSKQRLDSYNTDTQTMTRLDNQSAAFKPWLRQLPKHTIIGIEATNVYHLEVADFAHKLGLTVYIIDGYRLNRYRESVGGRAKTDTTDAKLIARYVDKEREELRAYRPLPPQQRRFWQLLRRRAKVVESAKALAQSLAGLTDLQSTIRAMQRQLRHVIALLEKRLTQVVTKLNWQADIARVKKVFGIGKLTAMALVASYHKGTFTHADAYVAFLGLDVRVRDSGNSKGKRKLTKKGDPECRRLLYNAAQAAARGAAMRPYYDRLLAQGKLPIQATVAVMRKLTRIAFALLRDQADYQSPASEKSKGEACKVT